MWDWVVISRKKNGWHIVDRLPPSAAPSDVNCDDSLLETLNHSSLCVDKTSTSLGNLSREGGPKADFRNRLWFWRVSDEETQMLMIRFLSASLPDVPALRQCGHGASMMPLWLAVSVSPSRDAWLGEERERRAWNRGARGSWLNRGAHPSRSTREK